MPEMTKNNKGSFFARKPIISSIARRVKPFISASEDLTSAATTAKRSAQLTGLSTEIAAFT